jgi:hypothetical protein
VNELEFVVFIVLFVLCLDTLRVEGGVYPLYCRCGLLNANRKNKQCCGQSGGYFSQQIGVQPCRVLNEEMKNNFVACCNSEYGREAECYINFNGKKYH